MSTTVCWTCDVTPLSDPQLFELWLSRLPWPERRAQVMHYRFAKDRNLCLGAGILAAEALRSWGVSDLSLSKGPYGKPYLSHAPGVHFNLSHAGTVACCCVSHAPVGVDIESVQRLDYSVAQLCCQDRELIYLQNAPDPDIAFTQLWTRKESYSKRLGTGMSVPVNSFSALPGESLPDTQFIEQTLHLSGLDYLLCVCVSPGESVSFQTGYLTQSRVCP